MASSLPPSTTAGANLAERLRAATWPQHKTVEQSPFVQAMLRGHLDRAAYCLLLRSLREIYVALEHGLAMSSGHPALAPVDAAQMFRSKALAEDLAHLHGPGWKADLAPQATAVRYARHLVEIADVRPELLLAHAYVRYLGDLSGGQALRRVIARSLGLPDGDGTRFYEFMDASALAQGFRAGLATVGEETACHADVVAEARAAFDLHERLFDELERSCLAC
jgi:heme oxygenase (biliverdin-producing, ferredoxin)